MHLQPSPKQQELIALAGGLARERFAPRAARHDRDASFPFDDYADLRAEGLLGLCVPEPYGGLGADFETYCLVAEQLAQGNASTALTFNMHCLTMLMMGPIADDMAMPPAGFPFPRFGISARGDSDIKRSLPARQPRRILD